MRRQSMSRRRSRKTFKKGVQKQHSRNRMNTYFMRGGIRL